MSDHNQDLINERTKQLLTINNSKYRDIINDLNKYYKKNKWWYRFFKWYFSTNKKIGI